MRLLERQGVLPPPPARRQVAGQPGRRLYRSDFVLVVARAASEEGVTSRRTVSDLSRFSAKVWAAYECLEREDAAGRPQH